MAGVYNTDRSKKNSQQANSARAEKRRAVLRTVHDVREQLNNKNGYRPSFRHELMLMYAENRISAAYAMPVLFLISAAISTLWTTPINALLWVVAAALVHLFGTLYVKNFKKHSNSDIKLDEWQRRFLFMEALGGIVWAAILLLPTTKDVGYLEEYQFAVMLVVIAVTTMLSFPVPSAVWAGSLPIALVINHSILMHSQKNGSDTFLDVHRGDCVLHSAFQAALQLHSGDAQFQARERFPHYRAGTSQGNLGRVAPSGRRSKHGKKPFSGNDEPRVAHAAQRHSRLF